MKRSSVGRGTRGGVETLERVGALLLLASDLPFWAPVSSFCSVGSMRGLTQGLRWVVQDAGAITKDEGLNVILSNGLADPLGMELLEL